MGLEDVGKTFLQHNGNHKLVTQQNNPEDINPQNNVILIS
jgi:hypothetical protein